MARASTPKPTGGAAIFFAWSCFDFLGDAGRGRDFRLIVLLTVSLLAACCSSCLAEINQRRIEMRERAKEPLATTSPNVTFNSGLHDHVAFCCNSRSARHTSLLTTIGIRRARPFLPPSHTHDPRNPSPRPTTLQPTPSTHVPMHASSALRRFAIF